MKIRNFANIVKDKCVTTCLNERTYISTDNMLPHYGGVVPANIVPSGKATQFRQEDVLLSNIRPYFRKTWYASFDGGCSADVLCIRADKAQCHPHYLYYQLASDNFVKDYLKSCKGAKMPRGDENRLLDYEIALPPIPEQLRIASILGSLDEKIEINRKKIEKLEALARMIYEHWFVQFDFPDANGKPYKSSGGAMIWNEELKQEVPDGWGVDNLYHIAEYINGCACQKYYAEDRDDALPVVKIKEMHEGFSSETEYVKSSVPEKYKITAGDILFSWSASLEVMTWTGTDSCLNQHIFHVVPHNGFSPLYVLQQLQIYIRKFILFANARKTTMGHITADHIEQSRIVVPPNCLVCEFSEKFEALYAEQIILQKEIQKLMSIRDWLLPMLMNGQVEVSA